MQLRTNVVRTYAVDPTKDHSECMQMLSDAGIYLITDLETPTNSINREDPQWNVELYDRYTQVIDAFSQYTNVIGFFAGNEVANKASNTASMAFLKAAVRDMKAYIQQKGYRDTLAVGYATDDDASIRNDVSDYLVCGDQADQIDMFGYNIYEWCGHSSYKLSGYQARTEEFKNYPVPAFFSEYGCNDPQPRLFEDVPVLFGPKMEDVWSGGIVYMYFQEANDYGLVKVEGNSVSKMPDFTSLSSQIAKVDPTGVSMDQYSPQGTSRPCPKVGGNWKASAQLPPSPNADLCSCMVDSLSCAVKPDVTDKELGKLFGSICGMTDCSGITSDASKGVYGAYSMCSASDQLSFVMNQYYEKNGKTPKACSFGGMGATKQATQPNGVCQKEMQQAGSHGTGTVTSGPMGGTVAGSSSGSSSSSSSSSTASGAAGMVAAPAAFQVGVWQVGAYLISAVFAGAGMVLL